MNVFISWSGEKSKAVGNLLDEWLQCVIQALNPWMSNKDIDRGSLWFSEITNQLKDTTIGIICLTQENKNKPWILFEAGALAKGLSSNRVCTLLIDLRPTDIEDPLAQFNHTIPNKDGIWSLVSTLNNALGEKRLKENILEQVFETYWPYFQEKLTEINKMEPALTPNVTRTSEDILSELLDVSRRMDKRIRDLELGRKEFIVEHNSERKNRNSDYILTENIVRDRIIHGVPFESILNEIRNSDYQITLASVRSMYDRIITDLQGDGNQNSHQQITF